MIRRAARRIAPAAAPIGSRKPGRFSLPVGGFEVACCAITKVLK